MIFKDSSVLVDKDDNRKFAVSVEDNQEYVPIRSLVPLLDKDEMFNVLKEFQVYNWDRRTKYCGVCGEKCNMDSIEGCKVCTNCNQKYFPSQFPAVIVMITKGDEILLAHNSSFRGNMHSVIAGFLDIGESLEECVQREIFEEVGLKVKNINYFGSQSWGFSSSIMIAFKADYKSGEIRVDGKEIVKAEWFKKDNLPELPPALSMGRILIDSFINQQTL